MDDLNMAVTRVLLVEDDGAVREALAQSLMLAGYAPEPCGAFIVAKDYITPEWPGVILSDIRMPGRDGFHLLDHAQVVDPDLPVILLTGEGDIPMAVQAMGQGAFGFLEKPCAPSDLLAVIERGLKTRAMVLENRALKQQLDTGDPAARLIFGISALAEELRGAVRRVARAGSDGLVSGAQGTGISKVAEVIHMAGAQSRGPFEKRASAGLDSAGLAAATQAARGGTLFLDEIAQLPAQTQLDLADLLEGRGRARVIGGSSQDLQALVAQGRFQADLLYRLTIGQVRIPALAERPEDIPVLFRRYVRQASEQAGLPEPDVSGALIAQLAAQDWPGNARALMSAAMRFVLGQPIGEVHGPLREDAPGLADQVAGFERHVIIRALTQTGGQASAAAKALKVPRKTFYDKLARYGLKAEDYRARSDRPETGSSR